MVLVQYGESLLEPTRRLPIICELPSPGMHLPGPAAALEFTWTTEPTLKANWGQGA